MFTRFAIYGYLIGIAATLCLTAPVLNAQDTDLSSVTITRMMDHVFDLNVRHLVRGDPCRVLLENLKH